MIVQYNLPGVPLAHPFGRIRSAYCPRFGHFVRVLSIQPEQLHVFLQPTLGHELLMDARRSGCGRREFGYRSRPVFARSALCTLECTVLERVWRRQELSVRLQSERALRTPRYILELSANLPTLFAPAACPFILKSNHDA